MHLDSTSFVPMNEETRHMNTIEGHYSTAEEVLIAKAVTMVILCMVSLCMGIIPMYLARWFKWISDDQVVSPSSMRTVSILLGFGGGVLFCTTFLHMLPEVEEAVEVLIKDKVLPSTAFDLAKILPCIGFFVMYFIEEIVHSYLRRRQAAKPVPESESNSYKTNTSGDYGSVGSIMSKEHDACGLGHSHMHIIDDCDDYHSGAIRGLLIVLGLSVHELFEGLAIGLESSATHVWFMFGAVAAHKFIIAFCIGVELITSKTTAALCYIYVCMFAVVSPMGIGIGMLLVGGESAASSGPAAVFLQGLASGTLLYVVFFEILHKHRDGLYQYCAILLGFAVMFGLQVATAHSHEHGNSNAHHDKNDSDHHTTEGDTHNVLEGAITETYRALASSVAPST